jgi:hypothetical protein
MPAKSERDTFLWKGRLGSAPRCRQTAKGADRNRRNLAVALRSREGPLIIRFADFPHFAVQASGLVS